MDRISLESKWASINTTDISGFRCLRASAESVPEILIGYDEGLQRCLILEIPKSIVLEMISIDRANLSFEYFESTSYIALKLKNIDYKEIFNDLILSVHSEIKDLTSPDEYSKEFVSSVKKWIDLFERLYLPKLSFEEVKGLYGELCFLRLLLKSSNAKDYNSIVASWTGPYNSIHDFQFQEKDVEVKTKEIGNSQVKISSESQLDIHDEKILELAVVTVISNSRHGQNLSEIIFEVLENLTAANADTGILQKALGQKLLTVENSSSYDIYKFSLKKIEEYNCYSDRFPSIRKLTLNPAISEVHYNLNIDLIEEFKTKTTSY